MHVLDDTDLLALYDRWDHVPGAPDTGIGADMGVEDERRAMWRARAAYVEAHRALNVAILRRHEGRLARALQEREVRGWLDALAKVLGLVEADTVSVPGRLIASLTHYASTANHAPKPASKGRLRWGGHDRRSVYDADGGWQGEYNWGASGHWLWTTGPNKGRTPTESEARAALLATLRADGWEVPEEPKAGKGRLRWERDRYCSHDAALALNDETGSCVGVVDQRHGTWKWFIDKHPRHADTKDHAIAALVSYFRAEGYDVETPPCT